MTKLLVEELFENSELTQVENFQLNKRVQVGSVCPYIYMHNAPPGQFFAGIRNLNGNFEYEFEFDSAYIKTLLNTTDNYAHVFLPIVTSYPIFLEKGSYELYLYAENYTFYRTSFIGWIRQHENLNNDLDYIPSNDAENPLASRLKVYREGIL